MLADVFEIFWNISLKILELDHDCFLPAPGLALQAALKKTKVKLNILTDINMLLMVEKSIRGRMCHGIHQYAKAYNKYMNDINKNKELSCCKYWDVNDLHAWGMSQSLPIYCFIWDQNASQFEDFIKSYNEESWMREIFLQLIFNIQKIYNDLHNDLHSLPERMRIKKLKNFLLIYIIK